MKIGRNELCPCGSGKKYKKCCLDNFDDDSIGNVMSKINNLNSIFGNTAYASFPRLKDKTKKLIPILEKYDFNDLALSIFCINSWIDNRSSLENGLTLNNALSNLNRKGTTPIKTYKDLCKFFNNIIPTTG